MIECFSVAYHSKVLSVPMDWLKNILFYDSIHHLTSDLKYYGLTSDAQTKTIKFQRDEFQSSKQTVILTFKYCSILKKSSEFTTKN